LTAFLTTKDLRFSRNGREILRIDEFGLRKGETLALVGPNGAGKSSLLLILALLQTPTSGTIIFDGQISGKGNLLAMRRRMALVFQDALLLDMSVKKNLTIPLKFRGIPRFEADKRVATWLERFGITHLANQPARNLSGGEAQRVSLSRACALQPEILLLDEPFAALDYPTKKDLLGQLAGILQDMKTTTIFVTHDFTEIPYVASQVAVLLDGRIIRQGPVSKIFGESFGNGSAFAPWESVSRMDPVRPAGN
jgi:tungstate transport system ATP-binding protein